ncbi:hypothetical protein WJ59_00525 [Burkholderia gladioli]|jgi:hypothetical protein|uniref:hypothetical protein n=1 Tax=Burkholderia gladioli TaxID=28095 RepID=UPI0007592ACB|nr:hypothetical protein [Burkholderia gladioli]KVM72681.1 hypothetical protein WJ59_00525 [Burkholderia gladioli]
MFSHNSRLQYTVRVATPNPGLVAYGLWKTGGKVHRAAAEALQGHSALLGALRLESRDFH